MPYSYKIDILRNSVQGTLTFKHGTVSISEPCWWDPNVVVQAGTYGGYATRMSSKLDGTTPDGNGDYKREGILFAGNPPIVGRDRPGEGIFIHSDLGIKADASDGCIVMNGAKVFQLWSAIQPKEEAVIEITVRDVALHLPAPVHSPFGPFGPVPWL